MMRNNYQLFFVGTFVGILLSYAFTTITSSTSQSTSSSTNNLKDVFVLSIKINFKTIEGREKFKSLFGEFARWIKIHEPGTISYELAQHDSNPLEILITERYINKDAYSQVHRTSNEFLEFKKKITEMNNEENRDVYGWALQGQSYIELNVGFM